MNVLSVNNITKNYGRIKALDNVSFNVPEKSIFGILGPNGSGKTTLLGIITEVLMPSAGSFSLFEDNSSPKNELRKKIGTLLETPNFYHYLSAEQNLEINARIKGADLNQIADVLKKVSLYERRKSKFNTYSLGMKQRLAIASALLGNPQVLILDEPTNGLDPEGIVEIRELIKQLGAEGRTIIMASHLLDEVEKVCNHVAILKKGKLLASGSNAEILLNEDIVELSASDPDKLLAVLREKYPATQIDRNGDILQLHFATETVDMQSINAYCFSQGITLSLLLLKKKSLESMFLELISTSQN